MTKNELIEYFETYVKGYAPFKNQNIYQTLLDYLVNYYYDNLYNVEPKIFKQMFEDNIIPSDVYDKLLVSIGLPQILIDSLSFNSKVIFLKSFSDFERYKSSISFVKNLAISYNDFIGIYELFIDYDEVENEWILRPLKIYKNERIDDFTESLKYDDVYPEISTLLVDSEQLTALNNNNQLTLPLKSNLVLLDYELSEHISLLYNFIFSVFVKTYQSNHIQLYFRDFSYSYTVKKIVFLWYYLLTKYFNVTWVPFPLNYILHFDINVNPFYVTDLDNIVSEYNEINSRKSLNQFYSTYFSSFEKYHRTLNEFNKTDFHDIINILDSSLIEYLDNRIALSGNVKKEIQEITNEIYNSLLLDINASNDPLYQKYSEYFLLNLSQLAINPNDTDTYLILYNLKPYHTELVTRSRSSLYINDKFNQVFIDEEYSFLYELVKASMLTISDVESFNTEIKQSNSVPILSAANFKYKHTIHENGFNNIENIEVFLKLIYASIVNISDNEIPNIEITQNENVSLFNYERINFNIKHKDHKLWNDNYEIIES